MKVCLACHSDIGGPDWRCPQCGFEPIKRDGFVFFAPELVSENQAYPTDSHDILIQYEEKHFWFRNRSRLILDLIRQHFPQAASFFEIGCGNGYVLSCVRQERPELQLSGCEMYLQGLTHTAQRVPGAQLFQMDVRKIPFRSEFDIVGAFDVLEHVPEDQEVLNGLFQVVKPGGGLILTVPQHAFLWTHVDDYSGHLRRYSAQELKEKVEKAGFVVERSSSFVSLLFPFLVLSRFLNRNDARKFDPEAEFKISPWLNVLLERILDFERRLIRWNIKLPVGGSLFLVARKK